MNIHQSCKAEYNVEIKHLTKSLSPFWICFVVPWETWSASVLSELHIIGYPALNCSQCSGKLHSSTVWQGIPTQIRTRSITNYMSIVIFDESFRILLFRIDSLAEGNGARIRHHGGSVTWQCYIIHCCLVLCLLYHFVIIISFAQQPHHVGKKLDPVIYLSPAQQHSNNSV